MPGTSATPGHPWAVFALVATLLVAGVGWLVEGLAPVEINARLREFTATAYCVQGTTRAGVRVRPGIVAADPDVLPLGSILLIEAPRSVAGVYSVLDTGGAIVGEILDVYIPDCDDATEFGRREVSFRVLRHGWEPTSAF